MSLPKILSLFSGAGGLDLGFAQAGFEIVYACDKSAAAIRTHQRNFKTTKSETLDLTQISPHDIVLRIMERVSVGEEVGIIGGPPCQGFSRGNSGSKADDPRNLLPGLYLDMVEEMQKYFNVRFVIFENVLGILDKKHEATFDNVLTRFHDLGFHERVEKYCALDFGVPQTRRRVIIAAFADAEAAERYKLDPINSEDLSVRAAFQGIPEPVFYRRGMSEAEIPFHPNHWAMVPKSKKFLNPDNESATSGRCFRRLEWEKPSPTVAYGHREMHVHPSGRRRVSIYEAMVLQGFPKTFVLEGSLSDQVEQVSNAVPPPMAFALASAAKRSLDQED